MTLAEMELTQRGIPFRVFHHSARPESLAAAALERGQNIEQIIRSILFRLGEGRFILVLAPGELQISWRILRQVLGQRRLTLASPDEVLVVTGYPIGTVSPFGLASTIPVLVDQRTLLPVEISLGAGIPLTALILSREAFRQALKDAQWGNYCEDRQMEAQNAF